jgi:hypothetical protein
MLFKSMGLNHIYFLFQVTIEEGRLDIHPINIPTELGSH